MGETFGVSVSSPCPLAESRTTVTVTTCPALGVQMLRDAMIDVDSLNFRGYVGDGRKWRLLAMRRGSDRKQFGRVPIAWTRYIL